MVRESGFQIQLEEKSPGAETEPRKIPISDSVEPTLRRTYSYTPEVTRCTWRKEKGIKVTRPPFKDAASGGECARSADQERGSAPKAPENFPRSGAQPKPLVRFRSLLPERAAALASLQLIRLLGMGGAARFISPEMQGQGGKVGLEIMTWKEGRTLAGLS